MVQELLGGPLFQLITFVLLGLSFGSFTSVLLHRLPRRISILYPPSHAPCCGRKLRWHELIPLISYLCQRGKCSGCRQRIAARYPLLELSFGVSAGVALHLAGPVVGVGVLLLLPFVLSGRDILFGRKRMQRGLTLVETLISVALIAIVFGIFADGLRVPRQAELMALRADVAQHLVREQFEVAKAIAQQDINLLCTTYPASVAEAEKAVDKREIGGDSYLAWTMVELCPPDDQGGFRRVTVDVRGPESLHLRSTLLVRGRLNSGKAWSP